MIDIDSKIPNLALMKISAWHKKQNNIVKFWNPFEKFDKVYASKIFKESKFLYKPNKFSIGGSGYNFEKKLPNEIEHIYPDYSLYQIDYAMGYVSRGCINKCPFCIVWKKEGCLHFNTIIDEFWNGQKQIMLLDNSITDCIPAFFELIKIRDNDLYLNLTQGFNVRTIRPKVAKILSEIRLWKNKQWYIAWDNMQDEKLVMKGIKILNNAGIKNWKIMCYILVNFNSSLKQDLYRINKIESLGIDPFVMIYRDNPISLQMRELARWCNRKPLFKSCNYIDYLKSKRISIELNF